MDVSSFRMRTYCSFNRIYFDRTKTLECDKNRAITTMFIFFITDYSTCDKSNLSHRSTIIVVNAPRSGECFHSYSQQDTNRSKERFGDRGTASQIPDAFVTTESDETQRDSQTRPHRRTALWVRNREADTSRIPRSRLRPRFMVVRANLCAPRKTCMAPASPPTACNRVGPNLANLTDVPVRFDRRSIIVKSASCLSSPLVGFTRRVAGACGSSMTIDRSIDRLIVSSKTESEGEFFCLVLVCMWSW